MVTDVKYEDVCLDGFRDDFCKNTIRNGRIWISTTVAKSGIDVGSTKFLSRWFVNATHTLPVRSNPLKRVG
jgi:hypothetical protein